MHLVFLLYIASAIASHASHLKGQSQAARELDRTHVSHSYGRSYVMGGQSPPPSVMLIEHWFGGYGEAVERLWPKVAITRVRVSLRKDFRWADLPHFCRLWYLESLRLGELNNEGIAMVSDLPNVRSLSVIKAFDDGALKQMRCLSRLVYCLLISGEEDRYSIVDDDIEPFVGVRTLRKLIIEGRKLTPAIVERLMDNFHLETIAADLLNDAHGDTWRRLERQQPYMAVYFETQSTAEESPDRQEERRFPETPEGEISRAEMDALVSRRSSGEVDDVLREWNRWNQDRTFGGALLDTAYEILTWPRFAEEALHTLQHPALVSKVQFTPDGKRLITASRDGVRIWDLQSLRVLTHFREVRDWTQFALSPDGKYLALSGGGARVLVWNIESTRFEASAEGFPDVITSLAFAPGDSKLAVACFDGTVHLLRPPYGSNRVSWSVAHMLKREPVNALTFVSQSTLVTVVDDTRHGTMTRAEFTVAWHVDANSEASPKRIAVFPYGGKALATVPDTRWVVIGHHGYEWSLLAWDTMKYGPDWIVPDGFGFVIPVAHESYVPLPGRDWREDLKYRHDTDHPNTSEIDPFFYAVSVFPNGKRVAAGGSEGDIRIVDLEKRRETIRLAGHDGIVLTIAVSPDGRLLASGGKDGVAKIWDVGRFLER